jgi:hypothetical protein
MKSGLIKIAVVAGMLVAPAAAFAQAGVTTGAATGAVGGAIVGGPVGAVVGGVGGAIVGGIAEATQPKFRTYVVEQRRPSNRVQAEIQVGATLPAAGVTYYEVPAEYGVKNYRYAHVNERVVLVDPGTRRVVQVID